MSHKGMMVLEHLMLMMIIFLLERGIDVQKVNRYHCLLRNDFHLLKGLIGQVAMLQFLNRRFSSIR